MPWKLCGDHWTLFASAIGRDLTCLNILGTGPSLPPKQKRVRRVLVQAGLPPTRFFKPRGGGRARSLYATPPSPPPPPIPLPQVLKDSGAGSATNKCL